MSLTFINPNNYIDDDDRACVVTCDNAPESIDEDWWNDCIDTCIETSRNKAKIIILVDELTKEE